MSLKKYTSIILVNFMLIISLFVIDLNAAPHWGDKFQLKQPDGSKVTVLVWGDEFYQDVESVDGYTLVRDPSTGWICYAELSSDGSEYISSGQTYRTDEQEPSALGIKDSGKEKRKKPRKKHLRINKKIRQEKAAKKRNELLGDDSVYNQEESILMKTSDGETITGLTVLVDFPDEPASVSQSEIDNFCNQSGYSNNGNNGSVADYFYDVSDGNLVYRNAVTRYVRMPNNKTYYDTPNGRQHVEELVTEALDQLQAQGFDFCQLSKQRGELVAVNILYAGTPDHGWTNGLWPHYNTISYNTGGVRVRRYQMTNIGSGLKLGTFIHENGHMVCRWPDLYAYDGHDGGTGDYCLMSGGRGENPQMPNPYFRSLMNWITVVDIDGMSEGTTLTLTSNGHTAYRYTGPGAESYFIEARIKEGRSASLPDEGLAIWHINTDGSNMSANYDNLVAIEQADGLFSLENDANSGESGDLFHSGYKNIFDSSTNPSTNWYDGSQSGLSISSISAVGSTMSFAVGESQNVCNAPEISVTDTSENSISLSWNDAGADSYSVHYRYGNESWNNPASGLTVTSYVIDGLHRDVAYDIAVVSVCADGSSQEYYTITATTDNTGIICEAPTVINTTAISASSISLSWNDAGGDSYYVSYKETSDSWTNTASELTTDTNYDLTGLTENTTYNIFVISVCPDETYPYNGIIATTEDSGGK
ncbi:MAG: M6 family metalloprotease domain-containing protein [Desulfobacteraceae bacterium]|nr:M6 family metalloprotease domain-containing protein [Desulfobacteraceae bacterium]